MTARGTFSSRSRARTQDPSVELSFKGDMMSSTGYAWWIRALVRGYGYESDYRVAAPPEVAPLLIRYVPYDWAGFLRLVPIAVVIMWSVSKSSGLPMLEQAAVGAVFVALLAYVWFPIVTLRVRYEGGEIVTTGSRWPAPVVMWSLRPDKAAAFVIAEEKSGRRTLRCLALDMTDGRRLALTQNCFPGNAAAHERALERLTAWLAQLH